MKITLADGRVVEKAFCASNCTGYIARLIEIDARDVRLMRDLFIRYPEIFDAALCQLEQRFVENRAKPFYPAMLKGEPS